METLNAVEFQEKVYDEGETCLVLFSRRDCHVCQEVHPMLEDIASDYGDEGFGFYHVDVDDQKDLFQRMALKGVPQVLFFRDGEMVGRLSGKQDEEAYIEKIDGILG